MHTLIVTPLHDGQVKQVHTTGNDLQIMGIGYLCEALVHPNGPKRLAILGLECSIRLTFPAPTSRTGLISHYDAR